MLRDASSHKSGTEHGKGNKLLNLTYLHFITASKKLQEALFSVKVKI